MHSDALATQTVPHDTLHAAQHTLLSSTQYDAYTEYTPSSKPSSPPL